MDTSTATPLPDLLGEFGALERLAWLVGGLARTNIENSETGQCCTLFLSLAGSNFRLQAGPYEELWEGALARFPR